MKREKQVKEVGWNKGKKLVKINKEGRNKKGESGIQSGKRMRMADGGSI